MSRLATIFAAEFKRFFWSKRIIVFVLFLVLCAYVVYQDCGEYKNSIDKAKEFQNLESEIFKKIRNYTHYNAVGFRVLCLPIQLSILFNDSGFLKECTSQVTPNISLILYEDLKVASFFNKNSSIPIDFSGLLLVFGTLYAVLFIGFTTIRDQQYLRMAANSFSAGALHFLIIFSRFMVLMVKLILLFLGMYLVTWITDIRLPQGSFAGLAGFFAAALLLLSFFFLAGVIIGQRVSSTWKSVTTIILLWVIFVFFAAAPINALVKRDAQEITSQYRTELDKLNISFNFEKKAEEKFGKFDRKKIETARKVIEGFWNDDYKKITALEQKQIDEIAGVIDKYRELHLYTPVTLYTLTANELSSRGCGTFLDFYTYVKDLQVRFVRFIIDRTYYNDPKVLVSFVKGDENLFFGRSKLPPGFARGAAFNLGIIIILYLVSFLFFKASMYRIDKKELAQLGQVDIEMNGGDLFMWLVKEHHFRNLLFNLFSGNWRKVSKRGFEGKVLVNGVDICRERSKEEFIYIGRAESIPADLRVIDFINLFSKVLDISAKERGEILENPAIKGLSRQRFSKLNSEKRFGVLMEILRPGKKQIFLIDNSAAGLPLECGAELLKRMEGLKEHGCLVIYLTNTLRADGKEVETAAYYQSGKGWEYLVKEFAEGQAKRKQEEKGS